MTDEIIQRLFERLPAAGSVWPAQKRALWIKAMNSVFELVYLETSDKEPTQSEPVPPIETAVEKIVDTGVAPKRERESSRQTGSGTERPSDIPTTFAMFRAVLEDKPGLTADDLMAQIEARYWPGLNRNFLKPEVSTAVSQGKLLRDEDGRLRVSEKGAVVTSVDLRKNKSQPPQRMAKTEQAKPPVPAPSKPQQHHRVVVPNVTDFEHDGRVAMLDPKEYRVAVKMRAAIGRGFLDFKFLAQAALMNEYNAKIDPQGFLVNLMATLNPKLAPLGLVAEKVPHMGYVLKAIG